MAAGARLMPNHMIGIDGLPQRAALVALLPAARTCPSGLAGCSRSEASSSTRRSKAAWNCSNCPVPAVDEDQRLPAWSTAIWCFSEAINSSTSAGRFSTPLIQIPSPKSPKFLSSKETSPETAVFRTHPTLGVTIRLGIRAKSLILPGALGEIRTASVTFCYS